MPANTLTVDTLREQILKLSAADRMLLADQIWDSLPDDEGPHPPLSDARREELDRRLAAHRANPGLGQAWEAVKQDLLGQ